MTDFRLLGGRRPLPGSWRRRAVCDDPALMYPSDDTGEQQRAVAVCTECPVAIECLLDALVTNEEFGVRGGLLEEPRRRLRSMLVRYPGMSIEKALSVAEVWAPVRKAQTG